MRVASKDKSGDVASDSLKLAARLEPILAGNGSERQGAALADLTATWLAGHHPECRDAVFQNWSDCVLKLVLVNEMMIFGERGWHEDKS